jgi:hypothetical protein
MSIIILLSEAIKSRNVSSGRMERSLKGHFAHFVMNRRGFRRQQADWPGRSTGERYVSDASCADVVDGVRRTLDKINDVHCRNASSLVIRTLQAAFAMTRREASNEAHGSPRSPSGAARHSVGEDERPVTAKVQ